MSVTQVLGWSQTGARSSAHAAAESHWTRGSETCTPGRRVRGAHGEASGETTGQHSLLSLQLFCKSKMAQKTQDLKKVKSRTRQNRQCGSDTTVLPGAQNLHCGAPA